MEELQPPKQFEWKLSRQRLLFLSLIRNFTWETRQEGSKYCKMRLILAPLSISAFVLMIFFPFSTSYAYNEFIRHEFGQSLYSEVEKIFGRQFNVLAFDTLVDAPENGEACRYTATIVFEVFSAEPERDLIKRLESMKIAPARTPLVPDVELYVGAIGMIYTVVASDSGYSPLLDFRCL